MWVCGSLWPTRHGLLKVPRVKCWLMWPSTRHTTSSVVALVAGEVTHALEIGRLLCSTVPRCNHDTWQPFVGYHWGISHVSSIYPQLALSQEWIIFRSIRLGAGGWLSSEAVELFLRDLAILMRWLHGQSGQAKITFNCSGEVLMKAVELKILRPEATWDEACWMRCWFAVL